MKKFLKNLLLATTCFCFLISATACDLSNGLGGHKHTLNHVKRVEATCNVLGNVEYWQCTDCEKRFLDENAQVYIPENATIIQLKDHDFAEFITVEEPSETKAGRKKQVCKVCEKEVYEDIEKLPHTHVYSDEWFKNAEGHFHKAVCCQDAPTKDDLLHVKGSDNKCTVCGYDMSVPDVFENSSSNYGYTTLNADEKAFYDALDEKLSLFHTSGDAQVKKVGSQDRYTVGEFTFQENNLQSERALEVYKIYKADHPLYYWLDTTTVYTENAIYPVVGDDYRLQTARQAVNAALEENIIAFYQKADADDSDYQKSLCYHDAVIDAINYSYDKNGYPSSEDWAHSILGVFLAGSGNIKGAVCEGYSKAFQLLLNLADVNNVYVTGVGATASGTEGHAWNLVQIDGNYYYFDLTWDDQPKNGRGRTYDYFCKSSEDFAASHLANVSLSSRGLIADKLYDLPDNISSTAYSCDNQMFSTFTAQNGEYVICGYKEVQLIKHSGLGKVVLQKNIQYLNDSYDLVCIGTVYDDKNTLNTVFTSGITEIGLPETIDFIWDISFRCNTLKAVKVDENNLHFSDDDGVLYTKNKFTLILYPTAKTEISYKASNGCKVIAVYAFENTILKSLTLSKDFTEFYIPNFGLGYFDCKEDYDNAKLDIDALCEGLGKSDVKLSADEFKAKTKISAIKYE